MNSPGGKGNTHPRGPPGIAEPLWRAQQGNLEQEAGLLKRGLAGNERSSDRLGRGEAGPRAGLRCGRGQCRAVRGEDGGQLSSTLLWRGAKEEA